MIESGGSRRRHGHPDRARPLLEHALAIYEQLDAGRDLARAEAVLRQAGLRRGRSSPPRSPATASRNRHRHWPHRLRTAL